MEISYKTIGGDGKEYGPISLDQLKGWVAEGRIGPNSQIWRSDVAAWSAASALPELGLPANSPPAAPSGAVSADLMALQNSARSGAQWFFWIAGLSIINTLSAFSGGSFGFVIGLGVTQAINGLAGTGETGSRVVALILNLIAVGIFVFFGVFARRRHSWAFLAGMVLYGLDGLIFLLVQDWLGVGFHAFRPLVHLGGFPSQPETQPRHPRLTLSQSLFRIILNLDKDSSSPTFQSWINQARHKRPISS